MATYRIVELLDDENAAIKILHGLNMFQDLQGEKEAVDWLMTIIVKA